MIKRKNNKIFFTLILALFALYSSFAEAQATVPLASKITTTGQLGLSKVSQGESLPLQIQLINFGTPDERIDVSLVYSMLDLSGEVIYSNTETVAVQTTASFVRNILVPENLSSGTYMVDLTIEYRDQEFPAISRANFEVEKKYLNIFLTNWLVALPLIFIPLIIFLFIWYRSQQNKEYIRPDYAHIPEEERTYYEIVHDTITSIRHHVGDKEMRKIIAHIDGVSLDSNNLYIKDLHGSIPAVISKLIKEYEDIVGKKANIIISTGYTQNRINSQ